MMYDYKILKYRIDPKESAEDKLIDAVMHNSAAGWTPLGGPFYLPGHYGGYIAQAMIMSYEDGNA